jgi:integrase/recombinase XerD
MSNEPLASTRSGSSGAPRGLRRFFDVIRRLFQWRRENGKRSCRNKASNAEYHLSIVQIRSIINSAGSLRDRVLLQTLAETGMRRCELQNLRVEDILSHENLLRIRHGKGGKPRMIPVSPELSARLVQLSGSRSSGPVFLSRNGGALSCRQLNTIVTEAGRRADVVNPNPKRSGITCHLFRHSFARLWKDRGGDIEALARILGHASVKTTWDLYGTQSLDDVRRHYRRVLERF